MRKAGARELLGTTEKCRRQYSRSISKVNRRDTRNRACWQPPNVTRIRKDPKVDMRKMARSYRGGRDRRAERKRGKGMEPALEKLLALPPSDVL